MEDEERNMEMPAFCSVQQRPIDPATPRKTARPRPSAAASNRPSRPVLKSAILSFLKSFRSLARPFSTSNRAAIACSSASAQHPSTGAGRLRSPLFGSTRRIPSAAAGGTVVIHEHHHHHHIYDLPYPGLPEIPYDGEYYEDGGTPSAMPELCRSGRRGRRHSDSHDRFIHHYHGTVPTAAHGRRRFSSDIAAARLAKYSSVASSTAPDLPLPNL